MIKQNGDQVDSATVNKTDGVRSDSGIRQRFWGIEENIYTYLTYAT